MKLEKRLFDLEVSETCAAMYEFIRMKQAEMCREGILVPLSGGLDSSTVLLLCVKAVGNDRVKALLLPERQGNPKAETYAKMIAEKVGIETITRDISPLLDALGAYNFVLSRIPSHKAQNLLVKTFLRMTAKKPFLEIAQGTAEPWVRKGFARITNKQRIRLVVAYLVAEETNLMVAGSAHLTEDLLGLFVKFGIDDNADIMPLKNLYRTQILQIARHIGVPTEILQRTPNPDIIPGVSDKYVDMLGLSSDVLDLVIFGIEHGMGDGEIAGQLALREEKVGEIRSLVEHTRHMRQPSQYPAFNGL